MKKILALLLLLPTQLWAFDDTYPMHLATSAALHQACYQLAPDMSYKNLKCFGAVLGLGLVKEGIDAATGGYPDAADIHADLVGAGLSYGLTLTFKW